MAKEHQLSTKGVRAGQVRTEFNEHAEALFLTTSFVFDSAAQPAARFANNEEGMVYSRYTNPTVSMFQDRLAAMEGAESCVATASGMAAILATAMVHLKAGDHLVCSNAVFGATIQLFNNILGRFGIETSYVSPTKVEEWEKAGRAESNPVNPRIRQSQEGPAGHARESGIVRCSVATGGVSRRAVHRRGEAPIRGCSDSLRSLRCPPLPRFPDSRIRGFAEWKDPAIRIRDSLIQAV